MIAFFKLALFGYIALTVIYWLLAICAAAGWAWAQVHEQIINPMVGRERPAPGDEVVILSMTVASFLALALALVNRVTKMGLLSRLAEQVTFVLIPPLVLIFLVLGTIFLGHVAEVIARLLPGLIPPLRPVR